MIELNKVYKADCRQLVKKLNPESVNLVYSDILFGTGRDFGDYKDLKSERKIIEEFYRPLLIDLKIIMVSDASILLQMDYRISHWMRCLLDDVFGYNNFVNEIIWHRTGGGRSENYFARKHDNIFWYAKDKDKFTFNVDAIREPYSKTSTYANYGTVINGKEYKPNPKGKIPDDVWYIPMENITSKTRVDYASQKPVKLADKIILACSNSGDVVFDHSWDLEQHLFQQRKMEESF